MCSESQQRGARRGRGCARSPRGRGVAGGTYRHGPHVRGSQAELNIPGKQRAAEELLAIGCNEQWLSRSPEHHGGVWGQASGDLGALGRRPEPDLPPPGHSSKGLRTLWPPRTQQLPRGPAGLRRGRLRGQGPQGPGTPEPRSRGLGSPMGTCGAAGAGRGGRRWRAPVPTCADAGGGRAQFPPFPLTTLPEPRRCPRDRATSAAPKP